MSVKPEEREAAILVVLELMVERLERNLLLIDLLLVNKTLFPDLFPLLFDGALLGLFLGVHWLIDLDLGHDFDGWRRRCLDLNWLLLLLFRFGLVENVVDAPLFGGTSFRLRVVDLSDRNVVFLIQLVILVEGENLLVLDQIEVNLILNNVSRPPVFGGDILKVVLILVIELAKNVVHDVFGLFSCDRHLLVFLFLYHLLNILLSLFGQSTLRSHKVLNASLGRLKIQFYIGYNKYDHTYIVVGLFDLPRLHIVSFPVLIIMLPDFTAFVGVPETFIIHNEVIVSAFVLSSLILVIIKMLKHGLFLVKL